MVTVREPLPCSLPPLPQPVVIGGAEDPGNPNVVIVTRDGVEALARYVVGVRSWIQAAAICLEAR